MHILTFEKSAQPEEIVVLDKLKLKSKQANFNNTTAKNCELMPEQTKEDLRQEAEDADAILHGFMNIMLMLK